MWTFSGAKGIPWRRQKEVRADGLVVKDFVAAHYGDGLVSVEARNATFTNLEIGGSDVSPSTIDDFYRVLYMPYGDAKLDGFVVRNIMATNLERGFSLIKDARNGLFEDVQAIAREAPTAEIPGGFTTADHPTDNIVYSRCLAQGFKQVQTPGKYWNGDGFADEEHGTNMRYEDCAAIDNADGGFDLKSRGVVVADCYAARNYRNFRGWGSGTITDFVSESPRGAHMWFGGTTRLGEYTILRPVFVGGSDKPHVQIDAGSEVS